MLTLVKGRQPEAPWLSTGSTKVDHHAYVRYVLHCNVNEIQQVWYTI